MCRYLNWLMSKVYDYLWIWSDGVVKLEQMLV